MENRNFISLQDNHYVVNINDISFVRLVHLLVTIGFKNTESCLNIQYGGSLYPSPEDDYNKLLNALMGGKED